MSTAPARAPSALARWQGAARNVVLAHSGPEMEGALQALAQAREVYEEEEMLTGSTLTVKANPEPGVCRIEGCTRPVDCRGLCMRHHSSATRAGRLDELGLPPKSVNQNSAKKAPRSPVEASPAPVTDHAAESADELGAPAAPQGVGSDEVPIRISWIPSTGPAPMLMAVAPDDSTLALRSIAELLNVADYGDEPERCVEAVRALLRTEEVSHREAVELRRAYEAERALYQETQAKLDRVDARLMEMEGEKNDLTRFREERDGAVARKSAAEAELREATAAMDMYRRERDAADKRIADLESDIRSLQEECIHCPRRVDDIDDCDGDDILGDLHDNHVEGAVYAICIPTVLDVEGPGCEAPIIPNDCYDSEEP